MNRADIILKSGIFLVGLLAGGLLVGCSGDHSHSEESGHGHYHAAPHGGSLVMLGDHFAQLELVAGQNPGEWSIYVLDGGAERFVRIEQSQVSVTMDGQDVVFQAVENAATGESVGDTSQFSASVQGLGKDDEFPVIIEEIVVNRQPFLMIEFDYPEGKH
ncbi:MAG TPA: hypothetical protein DIV79_16040 [Opitutae bacterium]|nr:hypothetical protein [Opitutaceae bacterium]HCR31516.1 hypothetical protein [Opitutae bacterium]